MENKQERAAMRVMPALLLLLLFPLANAANLSCSVKTSCGVGETDVLHMSDLSNAHAELPYMSNFTNRICCADLDAQTTIGTTGGTTFLRLSEESNAMVETASGTNFTYPANISSSNPGYSLSCGYGFSCAGYDTCLASISDTTNAHIGNCSAFTTKVCCSLEKANCPIISAPGTYTMDADYAGAPNNASPISGSACVKITSSDVVFDCAGYNITNNGTGGTTNAIALAGPSTNVTVRNCAGISGYTYGVHALQSNFTVIANNTIFNNTNAGIRLYNDSDFATVSSNSLYNNSISQGTAGIEASFCDYANITGNTVNNQTNGRAIYLQNTTYSKITGNLICNLTGMGVAVYFSSNNNTISNNSICNGTGTTTSGIYVFSGSSYNNITGNTIYNYYPYGITLFSGTHDNLLAGNSVSNAANASIRIYSNAYNNRLIDNAFSGSMAGINVTANSTNNSIVNCTVSNNTQFGIVIFNSTATAISGGRLFNNANDLLINASGATAPLTLNLSNVVFDRPTDAFQNFTNLSLNDSVGIGESYYVNWSANSSALPPGRISFRGKFVGIAALDGAPSIDRIMWRWTTFELGGYTESRFELWKYNASSNWTLLNSTPDTSAHALSLSGMNPASTYGILQSSNTPPIVENITLNSTYGTNYTNENLSVWYDAYDADADPLKNITNWYLNGNSIAVLNMPFEGGSNGSWTRDYSGRDNNGNVSGAVWNSTGGQDGKGAYAFNGVNQYISSPASGTNLTAFTIAFRAKPAGAQSGEGIFQWANSLSAATPFVLLQRTTSNTTRWYVDGNYRQTLSMNDDTWYHLALTYENNLWSFYTNGVLSGAYRGGLAGQGNAASAYYGNGFNGYFNGTMDDALIINRSLSADQILLLYQNNADMMQEKETLVGQNWSACVTPNDGFADGSPACSANLTIRSSNPRINGMVINSTYGTNYTSENISIYYTSLNDAGLTNKNITAWYLDGSPITVLNAPFEANSAGNMSAWTRDYARSGGAVTQATWTSNAGFDGRGAYDFTASGNQINFTDSPSINNFTGMTITAWVKPAALPTWNRILEKVPDSLNGNGGYWLVRSSTTGDLYGLVHTGTTGNCMDSNNGLDLTSNEWQFVGLRWNGSVLQVFRNGVFSAGVACIGSYEGTADPLLIGNAKSAGYTWNGTIDDVRVYNRSLTNDQILMLYRNISDTIHFNETVIGQKWSACVTPNDGYEDGPQNCSNNLTILDIPNALPLVQNVTLNSTYGTNYTSENLTAYWNAYDADNDSVKNITNWYRNGASITALNMPFEGGSNSTWTKDYSGFGNNGGVTGATWASGGGYDGRGAYSFDGSDYVTIGNGTEFETGKLTVSAWVKLNTTTGFQGIATKRSCCSDPTTFQWSLQTDGGSGDYRFGVKVGNTVYWTDTAAPMSTGWINLVGTYDNETVKLYVNGTLDDQNTGPSGAMDSLPGIPVVVGARSNGTSPYTGRADYLNGTIDEVRIFNRALSAQEILALYDNRTDLIVSQELAVGDVWRACVTPNDGIADGAQNCSNNLTINNRAPIVQNVTLNSTYGTNYTSENLTAYWNAYDADNDSVKNITNWYRNGTSITALNMPFEGGSNSTWTKDYSGFGNNGAVSGATWNASGGYDKRGAYRFDGTNDYITIPNAAPLNITQAITLAAWVKFNSYTSYDRILGKFTPTCVSPYRMYALELAVDNHLCFSTSNGTVDLGCLPSTTAITTGQWYFVAGTYDRNKRKIYVNGVLENEGAETRPLGSNTQPVEIGADAGFGCGEYMNGMIDDILILNRSLSAQEILALYNNRTDRIVSQELAAGDVWKACITPNDGYADGSQNCSNNVTIRAAPAAPTIANLNATDVSYTSATLNCNLTFNGNQDPATWIYYGTSDGGTNPASWGANVSTGLQGGGPFSQNVGGLIPLTQYFYRCFANNSAGSAWGAPAMNFTTLNATLPNATDVTLNNVNVTNRTDMPRFNNTGPASAGTAPGNLTSLNLSASQLSERWAAFFGNVTGNIVLTDVPGANYVYSWTWDPAAGGVVCLSTNSSLATTFGVQQANGSDIDSAWGFYPLATDSGANTFIGTNCTLEIGTVTISNVSYADTGQAGGFMTCPVKNSLAPTKEGIIFCAMIEQNGTAWNGQPVDFEVLVPTPSEPGSTETYYFYANLE